MSSRSSLPYLLALSLVVTAVSLILVPGEGLHGQNRELRESKAAEIALAPRTEAEQQIIDAYRGARRAVVNVSTTTDSFDIFGAMAPRQGAGSGVIIDAKQGYVITNNHVIEGAARISVTLVEGQTYDVKVVGRDAGLDLALLQFEKLPERLSAVGFGDSSRLDVGQRVLAIGNPFGLNSTLTTGIISSLGRTIRAEDGRLIEEVIQSDAAINPGNSGGPLLDTAGRVIGLTTAILSKTGESAGIGFAIPANAIAKAVPQLIEHGKVLRPKIGVVIADTEYGPVFLYVMPGTPADEAGISGARRRVQRGLYVWHVVDYSRADFILKINGKPVYSRVEVLDAISDVEVNKDMELTVRHGLTRKTRTLKLKPFLG